MAETIIKFTPNPQPTYNFQQIDTQTIELKFGEAVFQLKKTGQICLQNANAKFIIYPNGNINQYGKNIYLNTPEDKPCP